MARNRKLSKHMRVLLASLSAERLTWRHGYDLMKETGFASGTLYPLLMRMAEQGLIEASWAEPTHPGRPPRQNYRLTRSGFELALSLAADDVAATPVTATLA